MDIHQKKLYRIFLEQFVTRKRYEKIKEVLSQRTKHVTVVLQDVCNSQNVAAIMRTCEALGLHTMSAIELESSIDIKTNVARGAVQWMELHRYRASEYKNPTKVCIETLKSEGYRVIATSPHAKKMLSQLAIDTKIAFVFGTEATGLSDEAFEYADESIALPQYGFVESFNVAVSAALCVYDVINRLRNSNIVWELSESDAFDLEIAWMERSVERPELMRDFFLKQLDRF